MENRIEPNTLFDPKKPAFYGSPNEYLYGDNPTNRSSMTIPGVGTGLYNPHGPINICPAYNAAFLLEAKANPYTALHMEFKYTHPEMNHSIDIYPGKIYTVTYILNGELRMCSGKVIDIFRVDTINPSDRLYKLKIDCSVNYNNSVVVMKSDQIRYIYEYFPYAGEDPTIENSVHKYGTTTAEFIEEAFITNAIIDANGNIVSGKITNGKITNGNTRDGIAVGLNTSGHSICVKHPNTEFGNITDGVIIYGTIQNGDTIDGTLKDDGIVINAKFSGTLRNVVCTNTVVAGGNTISGEIFDPTIKKATVHDAIINGGKTIGGITVGDITTGGTTIGGDLTGGYATGTITGVSYTIKDPEVKSESVLITTGGTTVGGEIIGGTKVGNVIIGATVIGGTTSGGTTTSESGIEATAKDVTNIVPVKPADITPSQTVVVDEDYSKIPDEIKAEYEKYGTLDEIKQSAGFESLTGKYNADYLEGLLIGYDLAHAGKFWTNIKTTKIGNIEKI